LHKGGENITLKQLADTMRGVGKRKALAHALQCDLSKIDCERLIRLLLSRGILVETFKHTAYSTNAYVAAGRPLKRDERVRLQICVGNTKKRAKAQKNASDPNTVNEVKRRRSQVEPIEISSQDHSDSLLFD
jgi:hypothetical protein